MKKITITLHDVEESYRIENGSIFKLSKFTNKDKKEAISQNPLTPKECFENKETILNDNTGKFSLLDKVNALTFTKNKEESITPYFTGKCNGKAGNSVLPVGVIEKDEYTTLKEKCIELECKRLGVDKLLGIDVLRLESKLDFIDIYKYDRNRFLNPDKSIENLRKEAIVKMKNYIDRVEKELKEKENSGKQITVIKFPDGKTGIIHNTPQSNDDIYNRYKDLLSKEQIKELYKK